MEAKNIKVALPTIIHLGGTLVLIVGLYFTLESDIFILKSELVNVKSEITDLKLENKELKKNDREFLKALHDTEIKIVQAIHEHEHK